MGRYGYGSYDENDDWGNDHHPPCRCGCGELADECSGPRPSPLGSMTVVKAVKVVDVYADDDYRADCKWRGCTALADSKGYCDPHLGTL